LDDMTGYLDEQWHALVKADNLFGSRYALKGVRDQLDVIEALLRSVRHSSRPRVLRLGARYAESAAWLCEDAAEGRAARYWTGRAMDWALEAADDQMVAWTLFRRSQQATAPGNAAEVTRLTGEAWQRGRTMPDPMRAAILQQQAHGHALAGAQIPCLKAIDQAMAYAAPDDDPGDASAGHGSFCTSGYLHMQRGICWTRLGHPGKAVPAFDAAIGSMPPVYRRDHGVALCWQAACLAKLGEPERAASTAQQALVIALESGSGSVLRMVKTVASTLKPSSRVPGVASLRAALHETGRA
jgi:hypothetical protein